MSKKVVNKLDEKAILSLMADPTPLPIQHTNLIETGGTDEPKTDEIDTNVIDTETEKRIRRVNTDDYARQYLSPNQPTAARRGVYIDLEFHKKILTLVGVVGKRNLTVGSFVDAVLTKHFEQYGDEVKTICSKQVNKIL